MGGGILPMALYKGRRYFLFSRETLDGEDDPGNGVILAVPNRNMKHPLQLLFVRVGKNPVVF